MDKTNQNMDNNLHNQLEFFKKQIGYLKEDINKVRELVEKGP